MGNEIRNNIIKKIKDGKYFSIILDCTPDVTHQKQMFLVLRYVHITTSLVKVDG